MGRSTFFNNKGMALLITIMVISLLVAVTVQFSRGMRQNYLTSATSLDGWRLQLAAGSGIGIASLILENDGRDNDYDTLTDAWAIIEPEQFQELFTANSLMIEIEDLGGKLQVNSLVASGDNKPEGEKQNNANENRELLKQLLVSGNFDIEGEDVAREIVDALVDWLDEDDRESDFGAETSYYRSLKEPYECRNGPVVVVEELLLVKGMTRELLFGTEEKSALADFLTAFGSGGAVNINTAPKELLVAMVPQAGEDAVDALLDYRGEEANRDSLKDTKWYKTVSGWPGDIEFPEALITTSSSHFKVRSSAMFGDLRREVSAVLERSDENMTRVVYRKVD